VNEKRRNQLEVYVVTYFPRIGIGEGLLVEKTNEIVSRWPPIIDSMINQPDRRGAAERRQSTFF